tara:strand:+ start:572 stop:1003 length:432 start_codon:yes stop_codon:yes gene_type:complete
MDKPRPEITTRDFAEVCGDKMGRTGFTSYTLFDLIRAGWCVESTKGPEDIPDVAHWQILVLEEITTSDGRDGTSRQNVWKLYIFDEKPLWEQVVQAFFDDASDMASPTHTKGYNSGPMKLVALEASGKVIPHIVVALAMDQRT